MFKRLMLTLLTLFGTSACVVGAPPGFSSGDLWTVPLVAPLENDLLLVPVSLEGEGPFLFMVDPDSPTSAVEASLQASLKLYATRAAAQAQTEEDHLVRVVKAQVNKLTVGTLSVRNMRVRVIDDGIFWSGGRRVRGILGRDVISDSLIYTFDRDRGKMYIGTQGNLKTPEEAKPLEFSQSYSHPRRYLASLNLNRKHKVTMHLDLGARTSMLWPALIKKFKMPTLPVQAEIVDEYGTRRTIKSGTMASVVKAKMTEANAVLMLPYGDKRLEPEDLDGIIGQNFWSRFIVTVNWHHKKFWMQPRATDLTTLTKERLERWGDSLAACADPACVKVQIVGKPEPEQPGAADEPEQPGATPAGAPAAGAPAAGAPAAGAPAAGAPAAGAPAAGAPGQVPGSGAPGQSGPPTPPALSLLIERSAPGTDFAYDVFVAPVDAEGQVMDLPFFLASFRAGVNSLSLVGLGPDYEKAAGFVVVDMNPIGTRGCEGRQCVFPLASMRRLR